MGSIFKPKSTRARRGRSVVQSFRKPPHNTDAMPVLAVPEARFDREMQAKW
jgi:hypothetical protein